MKRAVTMKRNGRTVLVSRRLAFEEKKHILFLRPLTGLTPPLSAGARISHPRVAARWPAPPGCCLNTPGGGRFLSAT